MGRLDDPRSPFDHAGGVPEILLGLEVTLEVWSGTSPQFFRSRVFDLPSRSRSVRQKVQQTEWFCGYTHQVRGERVRRGGTGRRVGDARIDIGAFGDAEVLIVERHD